MTTMATGEETTMATAHRAKAQQDKTTTTMAMGDNTTTGLNINNLSFVRLTNACFFF